MGRDSELELTQLLQLWQRERATARAAQRAARHQLDFAERVERGLALKGLVLEDSDAGTGGRALLWFKLEPNQRLTQTRLSVGDPVLLWVGSPDGEQTEAGVVARMGKQQLAVAVAAEYGEFIDDGTVNLDREAPEATFTRGEQAIARLRHAERRSPLERTRELLYGELTPEYRACDLPDTGFLDRGLDATQRDAVRHALGAQDIALIHGPPGTGKTRTLCELVRQSVARGMRVLVTAASNTAVDNLGERLSRFAVPLVRLGHPARVAPALEARTLDALVDASEARERARRWIAEANAIRRKVDQRSRRERMAYRERRELLAEARALMHDARRTLDAEREAQLARVQVICATAAGVDSQSLAAARFDLVVLDEATQAVDPMALCALIRAPRAVLAGDPCQLPPTVLDAEAARAGLASSLFERIAARHPDSVRLLEVQYRMHELLMRFPSESMYAGKLRAAPGVATRRLEALPSVAPDALRPLPLHFIDCAGKGYDERRSEDDPSTSNPGQAERTAREVRRILSRGLPASELAVITPYVAQVRLLRAALTDALEQGLEVDSVDGFQGREKEAVIVDLVRSNDDAEIGFLADTRRMNVALTRAKRSLFVIGDSATLARHPYYEAFMAAAEAAGAHLSAWSDDSDPLAR